MQRWSKTALAVAAILTLARPAAGQAFGQWWWSASAGFEQSAYENLVEGLPASEYQQQRLRLGLNLHGFVVHPLVASFNLGLSALVSSYENVGTLDSEKLGVRGQIDLFPRGKVHTRLRFSQQQFEYGEATPTDPTDPDPVPLLGLPADATSWGGEVFLRGGFLRGLVAGFSGSVMDFIDPEQGTQKDESQHLEWSRGGEKLRRRYRLEHRERSYGSFDFSYEDLILNLSEYGSIAEHWNWHLTGHGTLRETTIREETNDFETFFLRNLFTHNPVKARELQISQSSAFQSSVAGDTMSHTLSGRYRWNFTNGWHLAPQVSFNYQETPNTRLEAPQAGVHVTWSHDLRRVDLLAVGSVLVGEVSGLKSGEDFSQSVTSLTAGGSVGFGSTRTLRTDLDVLFAQDDLSAQELPGDLPDLGTSLALGGTEDRIEVQLTLSRRIRQISTRLQSQWQNRLRAPDLVNEDVELDRIVHQLYVQSRRFSMTATLGKNEIVDPDGLDSSLSQSVTLSYRPWRLLTLGGTYRVSERDFAVELFPQVDSEYYSLDVSLELGGFKLHGEVYEAIDRSGVGPERTNQGVSWSISRGFSGLLPIVTAPQRRGVIR